MAGMILPFGDKSPSIGRGVLVCDGAKIIGEVDIGNDSSIWYNCVIRGDVNFIKIGKCTNIQDSSVVHVWHRSPDSPGFPTIIGNYVTIGHSCIIHACTINDSCLIGMGSIIMDGAVIGDHSIVGAGSVVTKGKKFPPRSLIIGNSARLVRELNDSESDEAHNSAVRYLDFARKFL